VYNKEVHKRFGIKKRHINIDYFTVPEVYEIPLELNREACAFLWRKEEDVTKLLSFNSLLGKALVQLDPPNLISIVSKDYKHISHKDIISNVEEALKSSGIDFELYDINEGGKNKNRLYINYVLPSYRFKIDKDEWIPFIQVYNCYDKFLSYGLLTGLYRVSSESALIVFDKKLLASRRHVRGKIEIREDMINIERWISKIGELRRSLQSLTQEKVVDKFVAYNIIKKVFKFKKYRKYFKESDILKTNIKMYGNTYYAYLISLMEYSTHCLWD
jgi:hypothetical protein